MPSERGSGDRRPRNYWAATSRSTAARSACPDTVRDWLTARGARLSEIVELRTLLVAPSGERQLVELKAVDAAWPLVGTVETARHCHRARAGRAGWALRAARPSQVVLDRLGLHTGDIARLGNASFTVRGALRMEPDALATPALFGPRVLIPLAALPATGLVVPARWCTHRLRVLCRPALDPPAWSADLRAAFPDQGWRIRDPRDAAPGAGRIRRPDRHVHDAGRPDLAAGRRHRRRQRRARLAGVAGRRPSRPCAASAPRPD